MEVSKMTQITGNISTVQNIGLIDRMIRFFGGGALLAWGSLTLVMGGNTTTAVVVALLSVYPLMTTMMGWDPFYQMFGTRTCSLEGGRNTCGTFPFELDSALGNDPKPGNDYDHSLASSQHDTKRAA
jgi:hypothetical protein